MKTFLLTSFAALSFGFQEEAEPRSYIQRWSEQPTINFRPVVGVLTQPYKQKANKMNHTIEEAEYIENEEKSMFSPYSTFVYANYGTFLETAGAQVVPLIFGEDWETTKFKIDHLNGILFPGGDSQDNYHEWAHHIYNYVKEKNDNGEFFPLWGTCQGFQEFASYESKKGREVIRDFPSDHISLSGTFLKPVSESYMFGTFTPEEVLTMQNEPVFYNNHNWGLDLHEFRQDKELSDMFEPLLTSVDDTGKTFLAAFESKKYPFFGVLYHPEKPWTSFIDGYDFNHSWSSNQINIKHADFFVAQARKNANQFPSFEIEEANLITQHDILVTKSYGGVQYAMK